MRVTPPLALISLLLFSCLSPGAQEPTVIQVGVTVMSTENNTVSGTEARDRLVKALNQQKPDKTWRRSLHAVPLEAAPGNTAIVEAKGKSCDLVLSTHLTQVATSSIIKPVGQDLVPVPVFSVTAEYQLTRVVEGEGFAIGSVKAEDTTSLPEVVWQALEQVAGKATIDMEKDADAPHAKALAQDAQAAKSTPRQAEADLIAPDHCGWLPADIPHADALRGTCEYSVRLPETMPNFICDETASRYRSKNRVPVDLITASVRYEDGKDSYSSITVNGRPASTAIAQSPGLWSTGEFGSNNLRAIFNPRNQPWFEYGREAAWNGHPAWVFTYRIVKQNSPLWRLHTEAQVVAPPYGGEVWVDQTSGALLRFSAIANDIPKTFPMSAAEEQLGYERVAFEDGSSYVLPTDFTVSSTFRGKEPTRNEVQLSNCHKFRAMARMVFTPPAGNDEVSASQGTTNAALAERELEQNNQIYAILREQTVREDAARLEAEQTLELYAATVEALWKLAGLEKQRTKAATLQEIAQGAPALPASEQHTDPALTLKARVNLVQVSVVLRDAKGRAVGNLRKEDFRLLDERKLQPITSFSVEQSGLAKAEQAPAQPPDGLPAATLLENHKPASASERDVAYVFDDLHSAREDLDAAKESAGKQFAELRAGDRVAIVSISGEVQVDFTEDREKLLHALQSLKPHPVNPAADCPPVTYYMADLMVNHNDQGAIRLATDDALACISGGMTSSAEMEIARTLAMGKAFEMLNAGNRQSRQALSVLGDVIRRTATMPGERNIVLVSPGFLALEGDVQQGVTELIDQAISSNIVINAVDVRGLYTVGADANRGHSTNQALRFQLDDSEARTQSDVMSEVASGTGGEFFHHNDLDEGFRRTAGVPEYIYLLGFAPQKLDGKFHKLKVTVSSPAKLIVQARQGYYALRPASGQ